MVDNSIFNFILITAVLLIILAIYDLYKKKQYLVKHVKNIPVIPYLPWLGSSHLVVTELKSAFRVFEKGSRLAESDHFIGFHGYIPIYMTANADDLQIILPKVLERDLPYQFLAGTVIDKSILAVKQWRTNRKIINKSFKHQTLNKKIPYINEIIGEHLDSFAKTEPGKKMVEKNALFVVNNFLKHFVPFYHEEAKHDLTTIYAASKLYTQTPFRRFKRPWLYLNIFYNHSEIKKNIDRFDDQNCQMINKAIDNARGSILEGKPNEDSDDMLINLEKVGTNRDVTLQECKLFTSAATDTTSFVFSMVLAAFGIYPAVQEKVFREVLEVVGPTNSIEQHHLPHLKYTEMAVKETLRFFPAVPMIMRKTTDILDLGNGKTLPKDTNIFVSLYNVQRSEKYWENPLEFNPDRFLPDQVEKRHPFAYVPFSAGSRNCPGYKYAMIILVICAAHFVRKYQIGCPTHKSIVDIELRSYMTMDMADKTLKCTFTPRQYDV